MKYPDGINREAVLIQMIKVGIKTNADLAKKANLSRNTVYNFFAGKTPTYNTIQAIVKACEMPAEMASDIFLPTNFRNK